MSTQVQGTVALLGAAFLWGLLPIFARFVGFQMPFLFQGWTRFLVAGIIFFAFFLVSGKKKPIAKADIKWFILRGTVVALAYFGFNIAVNFLPIGITLFVYYAGLTTLSYVAGALFFKERITKVKMMSLILSFIGLVLIYSGGFQIEKPLYIVIGFLSGVCTGIWSIFSKKVSGRYSSIQLNMIDVAIAFFCIFLASTFIRERWVMPTFSFIWIINIIFGVIIAVSNYLVVWGFSKVEGQVGSIILLSEILFGIILAYLFFGETVGLTTILGGSLILAAIILPQRGLLRVKKRR